MSLLLSVFRRVRRQLRPQVQAERCRHCGAAELNRRGLCSRCYQRPEIRCRYSRQFRGHISQEKADTMKKLPLPIPTTALPGTPEKVAVLTDRVRRRQQLHHELDARLSVR